MFVALPACGDDSPIEPPDTTGNPNTSSTPSGESSTPSGDSSSTSESESSTDTMESSSDLPTSESSSSETETPETTADDDDDDDDDDDLGETLISALCSWTYECCSDGERDSLLGPHFGDQQDCEDRLNVLLNNNDNNPDAAAAVNLRQVDQLMVDLAYEVDLTRSAPIADGMSACLEELKARACNEDPDASSDTCIPYGEDACALNKLFTGKVAVGGECNGDLRGPERDIECVTGSSCEDIDPGPEDVFKCVAKGVQGDLCSPSANDDEAEGPCEYGFYCAVDGHCSVLPTLGESCAFAQSDEPHVTEWLSLYAVGADPDAAFGTFKGNETVPCEVGLNCDPLSLKCVNWCDEGANCAAPAADDGWAGSVGAVDENGTGRELRCRDDLSCVPHEFASNVGNFYFQCAKPGAEAGDICNDDGDCADTLYCHGLTEFNAGTCKARLAEGKTCNANLAQCGENFFCGPCGLLEHRVEAGNGDLNGEAPGECDQDGDGDVDSDDEALDADRFVCQPVLPTSTHADHRCAGTLGGDSSDVLGFDESACKLGSSCAYTSKLSNGVAVAADYYCISHALGSNVQCAAGETGNYFESGNFESNQDANLPWSNFCEANYICYDPDNVTPTCRGGAAAGQACDYDPATSSKGHCASDLHCVDGICQAFLQPGDPCDKDSNGWGASDEAVVVNGFAEKRCDPYSASCQQVHGGYYCEVFNEVTSVRNYCVEAQE
jgi:hypothetical protein